MSVYIPGMEMPTSCFECKLLDCTDTFKCRVRFESLAKEHGINISRPDWCPLVPVPPHGDLIDRDETVKTLAHDYAYAAADMVRDEMPTIIPASDKEATV